MNKLIRRQRGTQACSSVLLIDDRSITSEEEIRSEWATYYDRLSSPHNPDLEQQIAVENMRLLCSMRPEVLRVSPGMVQGTIDQLNSGKAQDKNGLVAEHLKLLPPKAVQVITNIFNRILETKKCPSYLKSSSYKLPIPKKGKDDRYMDHYRGITVTLVFYKLLEQLCLNIGGEDMCAAHSKIQFGFTPGCSPSMASVLITEAIAESRSMKSCLYIASLDARKAFDVVSHPILMSKLFQTPVHRSLWALIDDMYVGSQECVRWRGIDSKTYSVNQGVKQGGTISPLLYKCYINDLLVSMQKTSMGLKIGPIYLGTPTVADDILLMSASEVELQSMLDLAHKYSISHRYELHPQKSIVSPYLNTQPAPDPSECWSLGDKKVTVSDKFTHLGLDWKKGSTGPTVEPRIHAARRSAYSMLGVGLHGQTGLDPPASMRLITLYVIPRLLHGLEAAVIVKKDLDQLDSYYRGLLRQIQGLPKNTATEAIYILLGALPIKAHLHRRVLSLVGSIARLSPDNPLKLLATRQLATKDASFTGWFQQASRIGEVYGINISEVILHPWPKITWKRYIASAISQHWEAELARAFLSKSTLKNIIHGLHPLHMAHPMWQVCKGRTFQTTAATTRARMLVGRYPVQALLHHTYHSVDSPACPLCNEEEETLEHLICTCHKLQDTRSKYLHRIQHLYSEEGWPPPETRSEICSAVLNGSAYVVDNRHNDTPENSDSQFYSVEEHIVKLSMNVNIFVVNIIANLLCHKLHEKRKSIMDVFNNTMQGT